MFGPWHLRTGNILDFDMIFGTRALVKTWHIQPPLLSGGGNISFLGS